MFFLLLWSAQINVLSTCTYQWALFLHVLYLKQTTTLDAQVIGTVLMNSPSWDGRDFTTEIGSFA